MEKLFSPPGYKKLGKKQKANICNECGPKGKFAGIFPNTAWGLYIGESCNIHDYQYYVGKNIDHKKEADRIFLNNLIRIVNNAKYSWYTGGKLLKWLRLRRVKKYYLAVSWFGGPAFWAGKNK